MRNRQTQLLILCKSGAMLYSISIRPLHMSAMSASRQAKQAWMSALRKAPSYITDQKYVAASMHSTTSNKVPTNQRS